MFSQLLHFEAFYQFKQRAFLLLAILFAFFGYITGSNGFAPADINFNSSYHINNYVGLFSLGSVFIIMFFAVNSVLRDGHYKMDGIVYSSSIQKSQFFWSRFMGTFLFSLLAFTPFLLGMMAGQLSSPLDPERLAPFDLMVYLQPWLIIILPNVFICSSVIFSISILTRSNIATYIGAIAIYMLYFICSIFLNSPLMAQSVPASPEAMAIAALVDPFGISAFFEQTQFWTPFEKNTQLLSFSGLYMWNRILWLAISLGLLLITYQLFSFRKLNQSIKKSRSSYDHKTAPTAYKPISPASSIKTNKASLLSLLKLELSATLKSLPFIAIILIWLVITVSEIYSRIFEGGQYHDSLYPLTSLLIENMVDPLRFLSLVLIIFYSGELVWRERSLHFNGIIDATPTSNWAFFVSKFIALLLLPASLIATGIIIGLGFQLVNGFSDVEICLYFSMFYYNGMQPFLFSVMAVFIQSITRNKYFGMGVTGVLLLAVFLSGYIGIEHPMFRFGYLPDVGYNNMTGFSGESLEFLHLSLYWTGLAGILVLISFRLWQRGMEQNLILQLKSAVVNFKRWERIWLASFLILFASAGATVFYNTNIVNDYTTSIDNLDFREDYERKFKRYEDLPFLYHQDMKVLVDLYPEENRYHVKAEHTMVNREDHPVQQLFITARVPLEDIKLENAELIEYDAEFDTYLFEFKNEVQPNQSVSLSYKIDYQADGYEVDRSIVDNGTYLSHRSFEPFLGYRSSREITDNFEREKRDLPRREQEEVNDGHLGLDEIRLGRVSYEAIISTSKNEIAVGSGNLIKEWKENGRNYYHYKANHKIMPTLGCFSSGYEVQKTSYKGINIEQYYYPAHNYNIDSITSSIKETLNYCINNFGAYSSDYIRILEVPAHWSFGGFAHTNVIAMTEDRLYLTDIRNTRGFNLVAKRTIHEVAHQWWGHILSPKVAEGASVLVEGFAKYTEAVIMDKIYGKRAIYQLGETANRTYFTGRAWSSEAEPPLYLVNGQSYLSYGKSYNVLISIRDLIGEAKLNQAIKATTDRYRDDIEFSATLLEFLEELCKVSPEKYHRLINDWFKRVITYDLSIDESSHRELENGQYEITMTVNAKRFETQESGETTSIEINEPIQIGMFDRHPSLINNSTEPIYLEANIISNDQTTIKLVIDELPRYVSIDPFGTRTDENINDNTVKL